MVCLHSQSKPSSKLISSFTILCVATWINCFLASALEPIKLLVPKTLPRFWKYKGIIIDVLANSWTNDYFIRIWNEHVMLGENYLVLGCYLCIRNSCWGRPTQSTMSLLCFWFIYSECVARYCRRLLMYHDGMVFFNNFLATINTGSFLSNWQIMQNPNAYIFSSEINVHVRTCICLSY